MHIFFIHASYCIGEGCKCKHGSELFARRSLLFMAFGPTPLRNAATSVRCVTNA